VVKKKRGRGDERVRGGAFKGRFFTKGWNGNMNFFFLVLLVPVAA
jgi:hypothetical protein